MSNAVEIKDLTLTCNNKTIFNKLNLNLKRGSFVTIMGANGSGKSRLAHILYGILPYSGSIKILGKLLNEKTVDDIRQCVAIVFENQESLFVCDTVSDELSCWAVKSDDIGNVINDLGLSHLLQRKNTSLSFGEKQLLAIACAILSRPLLLVLDDAINMLDFDNKTKVMNVLKRYNHKGLTIINITQNSEEMIFGSDVVLLDNGEVVLNESTLSALLNDKCFVNARVNLPFMAELCIKLKYYNLIHHIELDKVRLVDFIWK